MHYSHVVEMNRLNKDVVEAEMEAVLREYDQIGADLRIIPTSCKLFAEDPSRLSRWIIWEEKLQKVEMLFMCHFGHGDIGTVMEPGKDFRTLEMSLIVSLSLLLNPIRHSAPKMSQPYLILLVSEAIGVCIRSKYLNPDLGIMDCYLTALERSIILYKSHFSNLHMDDLPIASYKGQN
ncbi:hypothetical protein Pint_09571 [Pistacia integerrima]|uniref:Uncharacterized protein n=1 Tax=Pistacia integerrima TaxID=434235 RepID=A0ACC0XJZ2_9ROSI|nr:hypothetical protein Pint_09571 [Pistacia integerrima]